MVKEDLFDNPNQAAQPRSHHAEHFECDLGMLQAESLEVLLAEENQEAIRHRLRRCGIIAAIEHRQFGNPAPRTIDCQYLLAPARRGLEDANVPRLYHVKPGAGFAFSEDQLARAKSARHQASRKKIEFRVG